MQGAEGSGLDVEDLGNGIVIVVEIVLKDEENILRCGELARLYSPFTKKTKSALKKLRDDINGCPELVEALSHTRWNRNRNYYTARQVRLIAEYLCLD